MLGEELDYDAIVVEDAPSCRIADAFGEQHDALDNSFFMCIACILGVLPSFLQAEKCTAELRLELKEALGIASGFSAE